MTLRASLADCIHHIHELWLTRNSHLHGTDPRTKTAYKHHHLLTMIQQLYDSQPHMLHADRDIFSKPFELRKKQSTRQLQQFYDYAKPQVKQSIKDAKKYGKKHKKMTDFFPPSLAVIPAELFDVIHLGATK